MSALPGAERWGGETVMPARGLRLLRIGQVQWRRRGGTAHFCPAWGRRTAAACSEHLAVSQHGRTGSRAAQRLGKGRTRVLAPRPGGAEGVVAHARHGDTSCARPGRSALATADMVRRSPDGDAPCGRVDGPERRTLELMFLDVQAGKAGFTHEGEGVTVGVASLEEPSPGLSDGTLD